MTTFYLSIYVLVGLTFLVFGYFLKTFILFKKKNFLELNIEKKELKAKQEAEKLLEKARVEVSKIKERIFEDEERLEKEKRRLFDRETFLEDRQKEFENKKTKLEEESESLSVRKAELKKNLEALSGINSKTAREILFTEVEDENKEDLFVKSRKLETLGKEKLEERAKEILALAISKCTKNIENNLVTSFIKINSTDCKAKIIGKEGRNIKSFEKETGVQLVVDAQPDGIVISSFDPIRREIAARTLEKLMDDGVINPAKIEEFVGESRDEVISVMEKKGAEAAEEIGIYKIPKKLLQILGRLHFRSSYGQNILSHSLEMAHIAGVIADEIGADPYIAKAGALFHDIGKAVDFEISGSHVEIGIDILRKNKIDEEIIKAMRAHHREYPNENLESYIVDAADAISGSRPGARSDNANMYIQKLEGLERITKEFDGVSSAYALSAGREVRVFVKPDEVDDLRAPKLAREIAIKIEEELKYPGEIKVALIRETKIIEFAR